MITDIREAVLSLLYPPRCFVCRTLGAPSGLCETCTSAITPVPAPQCARCGHPFGDSPACSNCRACVPAFVRGRALGGYEGVLRDAVHRFKYHDRPALATPLGALLAQYARAQSAALNGLVFDALIPVPMHPVRRRLRGYNQSERLARIVGRELGLPVETGMLVRTRSTHAQVGLARNARHTNLQGAFAVPRPADAIGKTLLLIDDVTTTGSTLHACAETLMDAGAQAVFALTLAAD